MPEGRWFAWTAALTLPRGLKGRSMLCGTTEIDSNLPSKDRPVGAFSNHFHFHELFSTLILGGSQTYTFFFNFLGMAQPLSLGFPRGIDDPMPGCTYQVKVNHKWPRLSCAPNSQKGRAAELGDWRTGSAWKCKDSCVPKS